ncbi:8193_t:CDS:1 [Funneliformis geosporum]|uniref:8193_t:CDS:1 n=1 Tax=Funneliformis geosporum TaxID=1117311 RepID=A0A9W4SJJ2_9GLOM|nr:8193_t:CDS:1 [Funneliformis geosporum]
MNYAYDSVERELKKDLFRHLVRAKYTNSSEVSRNLITQFTDDLDEIAYSIWFIPNRLIYVAFTIFFLLTFDFNFGGKGTILPLLAILLGLFVVLLVVEMMLFKRASKLNLAAKKRQEEDNKIIYERINNLEYIKAVSGESYEEKKVGRQLDSTFRQNKKSLWYSTMFKAIPQYVIIPNIPIIFMASTLVFYSSNPKMGSVFLTANFVRYFFSVRNLNNEVNKIIEAMLTLDELSSSLTIVNESAKTLNRRVIPAEPSTPVPRLPFQNGDLIFQGVVFAYPKRPQQDILRNFSFTFQQGNIYGIAGKNGIGKSTITKTTLKLYELKKGQIFIGEHNIREIDTINLHQHICYQTNRPTFFRMSIAENVCYPNQYDQKDYDKLVRAAKKVGIYEFITKLPQGFNTVLREGGSDLSEGQKQQISAIKMFINDYDIYILDEILSNVHPNLKGVILDNIFARLKGKTVLVIDHHYEIFQYVNYIYQFTGEKLIRKDKQEFLENN